MWCQTNSNTPQLGQQDRSLCRAETAPLSECGGAAARLKQVSSDLTLPGAEGRGE